MPRRRVSLCAVTLLLAVGCLERPGRRAQEPDASLSGTQPGGLCLVPPSHGGGLMGGAPVGEVSVRVDRREAVILGDMPIAIRYLSPTDKHLLAVFEDGKQAAAFSFTFKDKGSDKLCLFKHGLKGTWQVWAQHRAAAISPCTCRL